jgi:hypothetical protein
MVPGIDADDMVIAGLGNAFEYVFLGSAIHVKTLQSVLVAIT